MAEHVSDLMQEQFQWLEDVVHTQARRSSALAAGDHEAAEGAERELSLLLAQHGTCERCGRTHSRVAIETEIRRPAWFFRKDRS